MAEYAVKAGLPLKDAMEFVGAFLTAPATVAKIPGVTPAIIAAAAEGAKWG